MVDVSTELLLEIYYIIGSSSNALKWDLTVTIWQKSSSFNALSTTTTTT